MMLDYFGKGRYFQSMPISKENRARYPKDWKIRSYFVRFIRAKGFCEWCGAEHGHSHPVTGSIVVLTAAHVYDQRPEAAGLLNLAALCQRCHNRHDMPMRRRNAKLRKHKHQIQMNFGQEG